VAVIEPERQTVGVGAARRHTPGGDTRAAESTRSVVREVPHVPGAGGAFLPSGRDRGLRADGV
jgi:hypothetical protein